MRERRICTLCHGDRCVVVDVQRVTLCPRCNGDGVELLELAKPLPPDTRQLVMWFQLDLPFEDAEDAKAHHPVESQVRESAHKPRASHVGTLLRMRRAALMADLAPAARTGGADPGPPSKACSEGLPGAAMGTGPDRGSR